MTATTCTGNLGGNPATDAACLTELGPPTPAGWATRTPMREGFSIPCVFMHCFLAGPGQCSGKQLMPWTTYYFANANDGTAGGASLPRIRTATAPTIAPTGPAQLISTPPPHTGPTGPATPPPHGTRYITYLILVMAAFMGDTDAEFTSASAGAGGTPEVGISNATNGNRWANATDTCNHQPPHYLLRKSVMF